MCIIIICANKVVSNLMYFIKPFFYKMLFKSEELYRIGHLLPCDVNSSRPVSMPRSANTYTSLFQVSIITGLAQRSSGICLITQLAVCVNILWCVNFGVAKHWVAKWGIIITFYLEVCPTLVESTTEV